MKGYIGLIKKTMATDEDDKAVVLHKRDLWQYARENNIDSFDHYINDEYADRKLTAEERYNIAFDYFDRNRGKDYATYVDEAEEVIKEHTGNINLAMDYNLDALSKYKVKQIDRQHLKEAKDNLEDVLCNLSKTAATKYRKIAMSYVMLPSDAAGISEDVYRTKTA